MTSLVVGLVWPYAEWGGVQTHFTALAKELRSRHRLLAFVPASPPPILVALLEEAGVEVVEAGSPTQSDVRHRLGARLMRRVTDLRAHRQMWRAIDRYDPVPDVFHVDIPIWNGTLLVSRLLRRAPVVQTFHTPLPAPRRTLRDAVLRTKFRWITGRSGYRLQAATAAAAASLRPWVGERPTIDVIGTVDVEAVRSAAAEPAELVRRRLGVPADRFVIGTLGQLIHRKGLDLLIDAAAELVDNGVDVHVLLGGDGPSRPLLERRALTCGLDDRLTVVSSEQLGVHHADQLQLLTALDVLVMPSREEGLPLTLLEALVMPRPAVVADVGAIGDVFDDGDDLLLVPPDDSPALAAAVLRVRRDGDLRSKLATNGARRVLEQFAPDRAARRHEAVLVQLARARNARHGAGLRSVIVRVAALCLLVLVTNLAADYAETHGWAPVGNGRDDSIWAFALVRPTPNSGAGDTVTWVIPGTDESPPEPAAARYLLGDLDGDGRIDRASWSVDGELGRFEVRYAGATTTETVLFGTRGDQPLRIADWDGDGRDDLAVYRPATNVSPGSFFWLDIDDRTRLNEVPLGQVDDEPVPHDHDGDGRVDAAIRRTTADGGTEFWIQPSTGGPAVVRRAGLPEDRIGTADFDGDGREDLALIRTPVEAGAEALLWFIVPAGSGDADPPIPFGRPGDVPLIGDFDDDGLSDVAVWRAGAFWFLRSSDGDVETVQGGQTGDLPLAAVPAVRA